MRPKTAEAVQLAADILIKMSKIDSNDPGSAIQILREAGNGEKVYSAMMVALAHLAEIAGLMALMLDSLPNVTPEKLNQMYAIYKSQVS